MGYYLDGRVSVVAVRIHMFRTADERLPAGEPGHILTAEHWSLRVDTGMDIETSFYETCSKKYIAGMKLASGSAARFVVSFSETNLNGDGFLIKGFVNMSKKSDITFRFLC